MLSRLPQDFLTLLSTSLLGIEMNTYEILASPKEIVSFFMTVPDETFFVRLGTLDTKQNKIKPYKALEALSTIGKVLDQAPVGDSLLLELTVFRDGPITQSASLLITPKDDYTLLVLRHVDKPVSKAKQNKESNQVEEKENVENQNEENKQMNQKQAEQWQNEESKQMDEKQVEQENASNKQQRENSNGISAKNEKSLPKTSQKKPYNNKQRYYKPSNGKSKDLNNKKSYYKPNNGSSSNPQIKEL